MTEISRLRTWERRVLECKKKHRPKLKNWEKDFFGSVRESFFNELKIKYQTENEQTIERISFDNLTIERFIEEYERLAIPLIISNIPNKQNWNAGYFLSLFISFSFFPFLSLTFSFFV